MVSLFKIKNSKIALLEVVKDELKMRFDADDVDRHDLRKLKACCKEIDGWIKELKNKNE